MNVDMLEIWKNYLDICSVFNDKLEEIKADEVLNINLELLKASITDLNINISNFKSELDNNLEHENEHELDSECVKEKAVSNPAFTESDKKNLFALFFLYLMKIDKDSILNNDSFANISTSTLHVNNAQLSVNVNNSEEKNTLQVSQTSYCDDVD